MSHSSNNYCSTHDSDMFAHFQSRKYNKIDGKFNRALEQMMMKFNR